MTLSNLFLSLQLLMATPVKYYIQDDVVFKQYENNQTIFNQTAKYWTSVYANGK